MRACLVLFAIIAALVVLTIPVSAAIAKAKITAGTPVAYKDLRSVGDIIADAENGHVHVIYVHGMRAEGPGESKAFIERLAETFGQQVKVTRDPHKLDLQPWPKDARIGGTLIWPKIEDWTGGQPFIDRYVLKTKKHNTTITIDEVNWWPLLFPLKCKLLLAPEASLTGVDADHLSLCTREQWPYHRWISKEDESAALAAKPALGGGARGNRYLKQQIVDWGLSDAVITLGPMRAYVNATMNEAFAYAAADGQTSEFVVISESLGSFAVLDAYAAQEPAVRSVLDATHNLYFFANQFALLELARIQHMPVDVRSKAGGVAQDVPPAPASPLGALREWAAAPVPPGFTGIEARPKQIISFSDPSDALTFAVPEMEDVLVSNVYVRNTGSFLGLIADPIAAHAEQMKNKALWKAMLHRSTSGKAKPAKRP